MNGILGKGICCFATAGVKRFWGCCKLRTLSAQPCSLYWLPGSVGKHGNCFAGGRRLQSTAAGNMGPGCCQRASREQVTKIPPASQGLSDLDSFGVKMCASSSGICSALCPTSSVVLVEKRGLCPRCSCCWGVPEVLPSGNLHLQELWLLLSLGTTGVVHLSIDGFGLHTWDCAGLDLPLPVGRAMAGAAACAVGWALCVSPESCWEVPVACFPFRF